MDGREEEERVVWRSGICGEMVMMWLRTEGNGKEEGGQAGETSGVATGEEGVERITGKETYWIRN